MRDSVTNNFEIGCNVANQGELIAMKFRFEPLKNRLGFSFLGGCMVYCNHQFLLQPPLCYHVLPRSEVHRIAFSVLQSAFSQTDRQDDTLEVLPRSSEDLKEPHRSA